MCCFCPLSSSLLHSPPNPLAQASWPSHLPTAAGASPGHLSLGLPFHGPTTAEPTHPSSSPPLLLGIGALSRILCLCVFSCLLLPFYPLLISALSLFLWSILRLHFGCFWCSKSQFQSIWKSQSTDQCFARHVVMWRKHTWAQDFSRTGLTNHRAQFYSWVQCAGRLDSRKSELGLFPDDSQLCDMGKLLHLSELICTTISVPLTWDYRHDLKKPCLNSFHMISINYHWRYRTVRRRHKLQAV